jgi:hypothetical protein
MGTSVRWAGLCFVGAGLLTLSAVSHPDILELGLAEASRTPLWTPMHAVGLVVVALSLGGVAGLALLHRGRWGRLGSVGVVMTVVGLVATAGLTAIEAFTFPALARAEPALLAFDGPIAGTAAFWILAGLAGLWLVGEALLGIAVTRAGVLPRTPGVLLAAGAFSFAAFEGPFVPVLGQASVLLYAVAQVWVGVVLFRAGRPPGLAPPDSGEGRQDSRQHERGLRR